MIDFITRRKEMFMTNPKCIYCTTQNGDIAWLSHPELNLSQISSNLNGTLPLDDTKRHEGFSAKIKNYGQLIDTGEKDIGYIQHVQKNPGCLEIRSENAGKMLFPTFQNCPLIIEVSINYCPICGRKLGITPMDI